MFVSEATARNRISGLQEYINVIFDIKKKNYNFIFNYQIELLIIIIIVFFNIFNVMQ